METGCIIDVETTGLDPNNDVIIEIGLIEFAVDNDTKQPQILSMYSACENPNIPIPKKIEEMTGIKAQFLPGQKIDWSLVKAVFDRSTIIIAHNAPFDQSFLMKKRELQDLDRHWACSQKHIDWEGKGFRSQALNYLAADHGFLNPFAHRALFDCATTFRLISPHLEELIATSYQREIKLLAISAPFETKDMLKNKHYRWDGKERVWHKTVFESKIEEERHFLQSKIYPGNKSLHEERWV